MSNMRKLMEAVEQLNESFQGETYDAILNGYEADEEGALDYARGMVWSEVGTTENNIKYANHIGTENGVDVYYDFGADYYFFAPAELEEGGDILDESYHSQLAAALEDLVARNPNLSADKLVAVARSKYGQEAATYLSDKLEAEADLADYEASDPQPHMRDPHPSDPNWPHPVKEGWPQEETHAEMVEYWKHSLSQSIVRKGVFTQMYDAAGQDIDELNAAIADQAESIADSYHGSGEGIGSSDQNHFIYNIAQQLGIDDIFGWRKPKVEEEGELKSDEEMERDKTNRYAKYNKAMRNRKETDDEEDFMLRNPFESLEEAKGNVVKVPFKIRADSSRDVTAFGTSEQAEEFIKALGIDDQVSHDVIDPETGELLFQKGTTKRQEIKKGNHQILTPNDFSAGARLSSRAKGPSEPLAPVMHGGWDADDFEKQQDHAWEMLNKLRDNDFYNVVWKNAAELVGSPADLGAEGEEWGDLDYDVDMEVPVAIKRKDGKRFDDDDHDNFREIVRAVKKASTMGNFGISYAGTSNKGTVARFVPSFM